MNYRCLECNHETCRLCNGCHNPDCVLLVRPLKICFDSLLPKTPNPPTEDRDWRESTIGIVSSKDGEVGYYTFDQIINDFRLGQAIAIDTGLPPERHSEAIEWLKENLSRFISQEITAAEARGYERGQDDAFRGKIENMKEITIHETVNVPKPIQDHFISLGEKAMLEKCLRALPPERIVHCYIDHDEKDVGWNDYRADAMKNFKALTSH